MIKGIFHIVVGGLFWLARPVAAIDIEAMVTLIRRGSASDIDGNLFQPSGATDYVEMYSYSYVFVAIGTLYIMYGAYLIIKEANHANSK